MAKEAKAPEVNEEVLSDTLEVTENDNETIDLEEEAVEEESAPKAEEAKPKKRSSKKKAAEESEDQSVDDLMKRSSKPIDIASKTQKRKMYHSIKVITEDGDEEIETEATMLRNEYIELAASAQSQRILTGEICGMRYTDALNESGTLLVEVAYGKQMFSVFIPSYLLFNYDESEIKTPADKQKLELQIRRRYGSKVDFIVRRVLEKERIAYASRLHALAMKGVNNYIRPYKDGKPKICEGDIVKSKIIMTMRNYIIVDALGAEIQIPNEELSYNYIGDAREEFDIGDSVNVLIKKIKVVDVKKPDMTYKLIDAVGSVKETMPDNRKSIYDKYQVGGKYAGEVTYILDTGVFVRLNNRYDCMCAFPRYGKMPQKNQRRIVKVTGKFDDELRLIGEFTNS